MGFIVTGRTEVDDLGAGSRTSFSVVRDCLMRCAYQAYKIRSVQRRPDKAVCRIRQVSFHTDAKKPIRQDGLLHLFDAWQFMAGVLPATLRAVAAQRSNPLPADLSSSGEPSPTDNR
ncbi:hypothetical protein EVY00_06845 [Citrobacter werkmanii]|nr:hypothetical protein EVY00_06845 [Citrobacter werkmanii]